MPQAAVQPNHAPAQAVRGAWACGRPGGQSVGPFEDESAAMAEADRRVAGELAAEGEPPA
jgi:hypothetical protein